MLKRIGMLLLVVLVFGGLYFVSQALRPEGFIVNTFLDEWIPFLDFFVIFYIAYFPFLLIAPLLYWNDPDYKKIIMGFLAVIVISNLIYLGFQTQVVRPEIVGDNLFKEMILGFYGNDPPVNALPSLHVSLAVLTVLFVWVKSKKLRVPVTVMGILISLSTVFIKQHALVDVVAGLILAGIVFWQIERLARVFKFGAKD